MAPQASLGPMAGTGRMARLLNDDKLCRYISTTKQRRRRRPNRPLRRRQPKPKKETPATFSRADSVAPRTTDSIDSYAVPSGSARPFVYIADGGKRHVKTRGEKLIA